MRYRIVITTYGSGRKTYTPEKRKLLRWAPLNLDGDTSVIGYEMPSREMALESIDLNFNDNTTVQKIEFEYIER